MKSLTIKFFAFADFEFDAAKRLLLKAGKPVALNSKTFDLLEVLIERRGEIVGKDELLERIWANQFVEESNLTVHVSTLRKILGEARGENRFIVTVPGKGYKFVGEENIGADEITVENHSFSRIVINEEIEETENQTNDHFIQPKEIGAPERTKNRFEWFRENRLAVGLILVLIVFVTVGGYLWQRQTSSPAPFAQMQIRQLTNNGKVEIAALSVDGKLFAYVTDDFGQKTLWIGQTDGGNDIQLRPPAEVNYYALAFSPDNDKLFFSARDDANPKSALFRIPAFGGTQEKIRDAIGNFALSSDGKQIAFARRDESGKADDLTVADLDGGAERIIASFPTARSLASESISFSPDGLSIAFGSAHNDSDLAQDVYVALIATGEVRQITTRDFGGINKIAWLTNGGLIVTALDTNAWSGVPQFGVWSIALPGGEVRKITSDLSSYNDALGSSEKTNALLMVEQRRMENVWVAPADDLSRARQITFGSFGRYDGLWGLDWLPDNRIVFNSSDTQSQVISVMNADGSNQKQLTAPGHIDSDLDVSEDGRYIVFHSTRGGGFDIWRINASGDNPQQLTFGKHNYQPIISPDSRFVFYKSWDSGSGGLRRISIDGGEPSALNETETSWMSVSPDGKFIAAGYNNDKRRLAVLPIDGGAPVKQFDFPKSATVYGGTRWTPDGKAVIYHDSNYGYWQQEIAGGEARRMENLPKEKLYNFAWSNDGKQFAFVRGAEIRDVVLISNSK